MLPLARWILLVVFALLVCVAATWTRAQESPAADVDSLAALLELVIDADADSARSCLQKMAERVRTGWVEPATLDALKKRLGETIGKIIAKPDSPLRSDAILLAALWRDPEALKSVNAMADRVDAPTQERQIAIATLIVVQDKGVLKIVAAVLARRDQAARPLQRDVLTALSRSRDPAVAPAVLTAYPTLADDLKPQAIELLTHQAAWSKQLLRQIGDKQIPTTALNINQVRTMLALGDDEVKAAVTKLWGSVREARDPARERLVTDMRVMLSRTRGDANRGIAVFDTLCGQCHKIHGQGQEVGPDITSNGRASYDQLLSNVFDPSLVIGEAYQARTLRTIDGRVITGLLAEEGADRVALKVQGGKYETVPRDEIAALKVSELSLMPEGIEKQLSSQEIADLFAFITLDKHPDDKTARLIPGAPQIRN